MNEMKPSFPLTRKVLRFYYDGFRNMPLWGKKVWIIIIIKLFLILIVLKLFFFQDFLKKHYDSDKQRGDYVLEKLTNTIGTND
jgi:hypothetical protein